MIFKKQSLEIEQQEFKKPHKEDYATTHDVEAGFQKEGDELRLLVRLIYNTDANDGGSIDFSALATLYFLAPDFPSINNLLDFAVLAAERLYEMLWINARILDVYIQEGVKFDSEREKLSSVLTGKLVLLYSK